MTYLDKFLMMMRSEKGLAQNTIDAYRTDLEHFFHHLNITPQSIDERISDVTEDHIRYYVNHLTMSARSIARKISTLKQFYLFLLRHQLMKHNPMDAISAPKIKAPFPKILSKEEIEKLLEAAYNKDFRLSTMLEILYATGLRISELIGLKKTNFSYYDQHPILMVKGKGGRERIVPLGHKSHTQLKVYLAHHSLSSRPWMFPSFGASGHITRQRMGQLLKELANDVDIDKEKVSPHVLRHAFATHMLQNGADLTLIKEILGHKHLSTSEIYLHVLPQDLRKLVEHYHPAKTMLGVTTE